MPAANRTVWQSAAAIAAAVFVVAGAFALNGAVACAAERSTGSARAEEAAATARQRPAAAGAQGPDGQCRRSGRSGWVPRRADAWRSGAARPDARARRPAGAASGRGRPSQHARTRRRRTAIRAPTRSTKARTRASAISAPQGPKAHASAINPATKGRFGNQPGNQGRFGNQGRVRPAARLHQPRPAPARRERRDAADAPDAALHASQRHAGVPCAPSDVPSPRRTQLHRHPAVAETRFVTTEMVCQWGPDITQAQHRGDRAPAQPDHRRRAALGADRRHAGPLPDRRQSRDARRGARDGGRADRLAAELHL